MTPYILLPWNTARPTARPIARPTTRPPSRPTSLIAPLSTVLHPLRRSMALSLMLILVLFTALMLASPLAMAASAHTEVNTANEAELDSVRGLGPDSTARIMKARDEAPFVDWADLMQRVKGIKHATANRLSAAGLTVNGLAYPGRAPNGPSPATTPAAPLPFAQ